MADSPHAEHGAAFARLLRVQRAKLGLRQEDVAEASGVSLATYVRWERGMVSNPRPEEVQAVCRALHISTLEAGVALGYLNESDLPARKHPERSAVHAALALIESDAVTEDERNTLLSLVHRRLANALGFERPPVLTDEQRRQLRQAEEQAERDADRIYGTQSGQAVA
ncbi:helix-turn-helix domain-containing protein [Micromonospora echinospora]|uniref:helix-turn-helix domain-containing protein n=1 Tax=Micromonospora echinospora TaxID=1877 RepID=UPI00378AB740